MPSQSSKNVPLYKRIHEVVRQIPSGQVATYGQIAGIIGEGTARMVGYALASLTNGSDIPWQRVINHQGKISPRGKQGDSVYQREVREKEGIQFDEKNRGDGAKLRWNVH